MKNWLLKWLYIWSLAILKRLRHYHATDFLKKANSKEGLWWNDVLIMNMQKVDGNRYMVMYCKPHVAFGMAVVTLDELICGTANLEVGNIPETRTIKAYAEAASKHPSIFATGVRNIGTLGLPKSNEPMEKLYHSGRQHEALKQEIWMEYQEKLKAEEPRKDG
jgi:hypothetical protein